MTDHPSKSNSSHSPAGGFGVQDVLYVLFKHKWKILLLSALGIGVAAAVFYHQIPLYQSQAKLLVRYVLERPSVDPLESQRRPPDRGGNDVINTEIEILTSVDVALAVAEKIGTQALLPESEGLARPSDAAGTILGELQVGVGQSNNVLHVMFGNPDPGLAKLVLHELINCYFDKHLDIHRKAIAFDVVAKQTDEVHARLQQTERELNQLRTESGILSLTDATGELATQRARTQAELMKAKSEVAELEASMAARGKLVGEGEGDGSSSAPGATPGAPGGKGVAPVLEPPPPQVITEYRAVMELLAFLQKRDLELRIKFKPGNRLLILNRQQLDSCDAKRAALLAKYPDLAAEAEVVEKDPQNPRTNWIADRSRLAAIRAKIEVLASHLEEIGEQFGVQYAIGAQIEELDRRRQMEDTEYRSLQAKLKDARIDLTLDPTRMPNITVVQQPSEPIKTYDAKIKKLILALAGSGMAVGVGLAFLIELLLDRRIKRPIEIQARLQLPLLLSIPYIRKKGRGGLMLGGESSSMPRIGNSETLMRPSADFPEDGAEPPSRRADHFILPFAETIRDRIIFNFEINDVTHKPKLVAVTGLSEGAGASTIAAGLARSFSEVRGFKVLLVDLSSYHPEDNPLFGEIPRHSLNAALQLARHTQFRSNAQNLYYASATARRDASGLTTFSPIHLHELMPHLQASQYDYIIFDMPPIHQTSRTLAMAGMMDKVLLVLDAENTNRDGLIWGYSELIRGKADVSCVFNKTRNHAPDWLVGKN